jgi:hypothetical protein
MLSGYKNQAGTKIVPQKMKMIILQPLSSEKKLLEVAEKSSCNK